MSVTMEDIKGWDEFDRICPPCVIRENETRTCINKYMKHHIVEKGNVPAPDEGE